MIHTIHTILSDLDGTLVDGQGRLSPEDAVALEAVGDLGILRVLITGRPSRCLSTVPHAVRLFDSVYASNGAECMNFANGVVSRDTLGVDALRSVVDRAREEFGDPVFALEYGSHFAFEPGYSYWPATDNDPTASVGCIDDLINSGREPVKLLIKAKGQACDHVLERMTRKVDLSVTHSNAFGTVGPVEVTSPTANKGAVATMLTHVQGRDPALMAAFGDRANDESILSVVGHPVAVRAAGEPRLARFAQARSVEWWLRENVL